MNLDEIRNLIDRVGDLVAAIEGTTDQFDLEVAALSEAVNAVEKLLPGPQGTDPCNFHHQLCRHLSVHIRFAEKYGQDCTASRILLEEIGTRFLETPKGIGEEDAQ